MKITEVRVLRADMEHFESALQSAIEHGWQPMGPATFERATTQSTAEGIYYITLAKWSISHS